MERNDANRHPLHLDVKTNRLEVAGQHSRLGKALHGFREVAIGARLIGVEETGDRWHDPCEVKAVRRQQRAGGRGELEHDQASRRSQDTPHLPQRGVAVDEVAEPERDGDRVDTGIRLRELGDVALPELDRGFALTRQVQHPGRKVDPDDAAAGTYQRQQLVGKLPGAGAEIEGRLAGLQPGKPGGPPPPGPITIETEEAVGGVVAGRDLVEHRPDPFGPRFLPHAHDYADHVTELARRVGLGLAARGSLTDTAEWARRAEDLGLDSVWVHDSYFERDPITYLTAMGMETRRIGLGAGALNPYTRHPVVVAMTMSALDDLAPRRVTLALGSGLPLRLSQMAIPYDDTVARVSESIDQIRRLWTGQPLKLNDKVPPLQPMFQPPHRIPIYIAAYRTPFLDLCGEKADGYLARPAESLPAFQKMRARVLESASAHGRQAGDIDFRGYLLCLFDSSRQEALNRAKREPFVIYMMSVLSDVSMKRAGFDPALRTQIATAWRAEDYHRAGELIPDELLDAFILCGTVDQVAARAADYHEAGMDVPLLQPILQEEAQINAVLDAAVAYASRAAMAPTLPSPASGGGKRNPVPAGVGRVGPGLGRRLAGAWEVVRPFSFTASLLPVSVGGAIALSQGRMHWALFVAALLGALGLHIGTNVINEIYDVRHGRAAAAADPAGRGPDQRRPRRRRCVCVACGSPQHGPHPSLPHRGRER